MNNKIFIDSSIFIESFKGNIIAKEILEKSVDSFEIFLNSIVFSEVIFKLISLKSGKSALTLKTQKEILFVLEELRNYLDLIFLFDVLEENKDVLKISAEFMKKYNLLSNDAIILATCKYYNIKNLASFDKDFEHATKNEGIKLITDASNLINGRI